MIRTKLIKKFKTEKKTSKLKRILIRNPEELLLKTISQNMFEISLIPAVNCKWSKILGVEFCQLTENTVL